VLVPRPDVTEQGRRMALRVGAAFIVLMAVNVGIGLWLIARHETNNPNRALLETQMRQQIANSLEHAAATFTPAPLGVVEITVPAAPGKMDVVADEVVTIATRFGGSATKGLPDRGRLSVLVDVPSNREPEFRAAILSMVGQALPGSATPATASQTSGSSAFAKATADKPTPAKATQEPGSTIPATGEKKSFIVQVVEKPVKSD